MKRLAAVLLVFGTVLCSVALFGQTYLGNINGIVTDSSGAIIPNATVTVTNLGKGIKHTYKANESVNT